MRTTDEEMRDLLTNLYKQHSDVNNSLHQSVESLALQRRELLLVQNKLMEKHIGIHFHDNMKGDRSVWKEEDEQHRIYAQLMPLTWKDYLANRFSSGFDRIAHKIDKSRQRANEIEEELDLIGHQQPPSSTDRSAVPHNTPQDMKEVCLLYHWTLEQFSPFKQWILAGQLAAYEGLIPLPRECISFSTWLIAWIIFMSCQLFFVYWILAWGAANGSKVIANWGMNFLIATLQDLFMIQVVKISLFYLILISSIKPQLEVIRTRLQGIARELFLKEMYPDEAQMKESKLHSPNITDTMTAFHMVSTLSPVVRLAHSNPDISETLFMGKVLHAVNDLDWYSCQQQHVWSSNASGIQSGRSIALGRLLLTSTLIFVPISLALFGEVGAEIALDIAMPSLTSAYLLLNEVLLSLSIDTLIVIYCVGFGILFARYLFRKRKAAKEKGRNHIETAFSFDKKFDAGIVLLKAQRRALAKERRLTVKGLFSTKNTLLTMFPQFQPTFSSISFAIYGLSSVYDEIVSRFIVFLAVAFDLDLWNHRLHRHLNDHKDCMIKKERQWLSMNCVECSITSRDPVEEKKRRRSLAPLACDDTDGEEMLQLISQKALKRQVVHEQVIEWLNKHALRSEPSYEYLLSLFNDPVPHNAKTEGDAKKEKRKPKLPLPAPRERGLFINTSPDLNRSMSGSILSSPRLRLTSIYYQKDSFGHDDKFWDGMLPQEDDGVLFALGDYFVEGVGQIVPSSKSHSNSTEREEELWRNRQSYLSYCAFYD